MLEPFAPAPAPYSHFVRDVANYVEKATHGEATRSTQRKRVGKQQRLSKHDRKRRRLRSSTSPEDYWVFGYGSLIWKPPPHYEQSVTGYIKGHVRRFWQNSTDHRGTEEKPGRVVTLIPMEEWKSIKDCHQQSEDDVTWGVAYKIPADYAEDVRQNLDTREAGYAVRRIDIYQTGLDEPVVKQAFVYIATTCNKDFCGPADLESISRQICDCKGKSGSNAEYLLNLAMALREIAPDCHDDHLFELERKVLSVLGSKNCAERVSHDIERSNSKTDDNADDTLASKQNTDADSLQSQSEEVCDT